MAKIITPIGSHVTQNSPYMVIREIVNCFCSFCRRLLIWENLSAASEKPTSKNTTFQNKFEKVCKSSMRSTNICDLQLKLVLSLWCAEVAVFSNISGREFFWQITCVDHILKLKTKCRRHSRLEPKKFRSADEVFEVDEHVKIQRIDQLHCKCL